MMPTYEPLDKVYAPAAVTNPFPGVFVVDFGSNVAGVSRLKAIPSGDAGQRIVLRHAEVLQHEHLPDLKGDINKTMIYTGNLRTARATDTYIMKGGGADKAYMPTTTYHGGRYVEVTGYPGTLTAGDIEFHHFHTANARAAEVTFESPTLGKLQKMAVGSQRSNMMTVPTDCDQRDERLGWMGDADLSGESILQNFDSAAFVKGFLNNMLVHPPTPPPPCPAHCCVPACRCPGSSSPCGHVTP
jgi:alpha-L-rhamnosidase